MEWISTMVHTINLTLLISAKLHSLLIILYQSVITCDNRGGGGNFWTAHHIKGWQKWKGWWWCKSVLISIQLMEPQTCHHFIPTTPWSLYHVAYYLAKKFLSMDMSVVMLMYMEKIVYVMVAIEIWKRIQGELSGW